jgi:hypothetical protein
MNDNILSTSGKAFQKFISHLTEKLSKPKTKFIKDLLCGILFASNLILTNIASKVPHPSRITAIAKRFRRQLADGQPFIKPLWFNYLAIASRRLDIDSLFPIDLTDLAKPYAKKMENIALVRDGDKGTLVTGYWCMEAYALDKDGILWPLLIWPYSLEAEGVLSENEQVLKALSLLDEYFGEGFGIYIFDRGFDRWNIIEPFLALKRHFIIRQRGDRTVVVNNGVHIILRDLVEHLFADNPGQWLVYKKVYLPNTNKPLYVVAYHTKGYDEPVILRTFMVVENSEQALQIRNRYARRWVGCESSVEFLKNQIGIERFKVRRYQSMQQLIFLAAIAMGFLSYLLSRCRRIRRIVDDGLRYCRQPKSLWFYRVIIALRDAFNRRAQRGLLCWCRLPP